MDKKTAIIIGAGPAGLTAARELLDRVPGVTPVVLESTDMVGGISRTVNHHGNRIDIGGHRFFSKSEAVNQFWNRHAAMPVRNRVSRIYYRRRFFDYPVSMSFKTIRSLGLWQTLKAGMGYLAVCLHKRPEHSLEDFYINRFGAPLYSMFFEDYTEKVWGRHPSQLDADWGAQRVKGLSIRAVLKDMLSKAVGRCQKKVETSLISQFNYPAHGPGELWENVAASVVESGAALHLRSAVTGVHLAGSRIESVTVRHADGSTETMACDMLLSSMPIKDLVAAMDNVPDDVRRIASELPYRDFMTVGVLVRGKCTLPDNWIYIQDRDVRVGRLQIFNNWSPDMVADSGEMTWMGMEYFCNEGDSMWQMSDADFTRMAVGELARIGLVDPADVVDTVRIRMPKAYPAYFGAYHELPRVREWLDSVENLYCIGRNGQHRYNNMDHSMLTAMAAVDCIAAGATDRSAVWNVNTDDEYHESK